MIKGSAGYTDRQIIAHKALDDRPYNDAYETLNDIEFQTLAEALSQRI